MDKHTAGTWRVSASGCDEFGNNLHVIDGAQHMDAVDRSRLIAAAPSLLEALKDLVARFPEGSYEGAFSANARRVIAKAEGR